MQKSKTTLKHTFVEALDNYKKKNFKAAEILCRKILSIDRNDFESKVLLANMSAKNRDYKQAKQLLNEANDVRPNNVSVLNNIGTACKNLGELKNAISYNYGRKKEKKIIKKKN